ncbi:organic cation transporter protein [Octopus vulgaris]|uniref:Organic cation transporter protein n=2 Tax=Octopus TaxID=6643 RepID=A0AA36AQJ7_OCTVU|nr:organic cation transporter protein isoform X1 [Octopus sinensis]XP_036357517.1 organic cation transporter protein isoform X1 [Octopus sinensis]XP_036357518.1 organic cation transporter protein isoform X1 [Octopus sinensis]XP_036357519.1 organic cation transporter protein isoform X1 [Octopus sinensis]XP_036357520.1 organic cation transporter protein isoform X1 [Octopus sinensis]CAI9720481.1 organic cation transporter protein [Octopus vulgaris]
MFSYEQIFEELRGFGPYQRRLFILVSLLEISAGLAMVLPIFTHAKMNWYCVSANYSEGTNTTVTPDWNNTQRENSNSSDKLLSLSCNALLQKEQCSKIIFDSEFTSIVSEWNLVCDQSYTITLINTLTMVGLLFGSLLTGPLSDYFGRKKILYGSYFLLLIFQIASGLTVSWQVYCGCRVLIGAFITCVMISNYILPMEFIVPKWRTVVGCVGFWAIGICLTSLWAYLIRDWRILTISSACFGFPFLLTWWFVAESPRWLLTKGKHEEMRKIITDMAQVNKRPIPDFAKLELFIQEDGNNEHVTNTMNGKKGQTTYSYWHLFNSIQNCKFTLILMFGWFVCCSVYYGLLFNTKSLHGDRYINLFLSGIVELPALLFVILVNNKFGRKRTIFLLVSSTGVLSTSVLIFHIFETASNYETVITVIITLAKSTGTGAWAALQVLTAEMFPTVVRSLGIAACSTMARIGAIIAMLILTLDELGKLIPFIIFGIECILFSVVLLFLPETSGLPLKDILNK